MFVLSGICMIVAVIILIYIMSHGDELSSGTSGFLNGFCIAMFIVSAILCGISRI